MSFKAKFLVKGFTLLELLTVVAIVGILAAVALPTMQNYLSRSRYSELVTASNPYRKAIEICYQTTRNLNNCVAGQNGVPQNVLTPTAGLVAFVLVLNGGQIYVFPNNKNGFNLANDYYTLSPRVVNGQLRWTFGGPGAKYI